MERDLVQAFVDAFNSEDLDELEMVLDDDVVLVGMRGRHVGIPAVRKWATRKPGGELHQRLVLDSVEMGPGERMVASIDREWLWKGTEEVADRSRLQVTVAVRGNRITHWEIDEV